MALSIPNPALVLLVGPSGAGKSTFARAHFRPTEIISSDELRERVSDDANDQVASADAFRVLALLVNARLKRRLNAVIDATNLRARNRKRLAALAVRYGVPVVAIAFDLPEQDYFNNNVRRPDRRVEPHVITDQIELMRQALLDLHGEGYAAIHFVGREPAKGGVGGNRVDDVGAEIGQLRASEDPDDRAFAAFQLGGRRKSKAVIAALREQLSDPSEEVAAFAAQSLAIHGDIDSLHIIVALLEAQVGSKVTPIAWAAARLAEASSPELRTSMENALRRLAARGSPDVVRQVEILLLSDGDVVR